MLVALPLGVLAFQVARTGPAAFLKALADPIALHSLKLTFVTAAVMVVINVVTGTATAWVLVRYPFPGKNLVDALIDLPFAVPTVVTGRHAGGALRSRQCGGDRAGAVRSGA